jgi:hypothetical protein
MIFRTRDLLVRQRTQLINALRGHLAEHGVQPSDFISEPGSLDWTSAPNGASLLITRRRRARPRRSRTTGPNARLQVVGGRAIGGRPETRETT